MTTKARPCAGIIFDIDGTLVDSNEAHATAWHEAFQHFGKDLSLDLIRGQIGKGGDLLVPDLLNAREMRSIGEKVKAWRKKRFASHYLPSVRPFPGAAEAVLELASMGVRVALASSSDPEDVDHHIETLGIGDVLEGATSKKDAKFSKPSPEIFRSALEKLGTAAAETLAVGDTPYDILAAHRAVLPVAAVLCGGFPQKHLEKAEFLFNDVRELARRTDDIERYFRP